MALSSRMIHGSATLNQNVPLVILNEVGKSGMLRTFSLSNSNNITNIKIEVDDVIIYNGTNRQLFAALYSGSAGDDAFVHGAAIKVHAGNYGEAVHSNGRLFNIKFIKSLKITITNNQSPSAIPNYYSGDYVLDII